MGYWEQFIYLPWAAFYMVAVTAFAAWVAHRTSWAAFPILATSLASGVYQAAYFYNPWNGHFDILTFILLGKYALLSMVAVMVAAWALAVTPEKFTKGVRWALFGICVASSLLTVYQGAYGLIPGGFVGNPSMNGGLIAALIPFMCAEVLWPAIPFAIAAVILTHASIPVGVLLILLAVFMEWLGGLLMAGFFTIFFLLGFESVFKFGHYPHALMDSNGRLQVYRWVWEWWQTYSPHLFGAGLGSGSQFIQLVQRMNGQYAGLFPWLHSDWLQIGFELGYAGLAAALIAYGYLIIRAWDSITTRASLLAFGGLMMFNWPLHAPLHATCMILVAYLALRERRSNGQESKS